MLRIGSTKSLRWQNSNRAWRQRRSGSSAHPGDATGSNRNVYSTSSPTRSAPPPRCSATSNTTLRKPSRASTRAMPKLGGRSEQDLDPGPHKRSAAAQLGVDVYSSNQQLQQLLNAVAQGTQRGQGAKLDITPDPQHLRRRAVWQRCAQSTPRLAPEEFIERRSARRNQGQPA